MSCLCGDVCCSSCGPAQGNWRCPICGIWVSEVCVHVGKNGKVKVVYRKQAEAQARAEAEAEAKQIAEDQLLSEQPWD